MTPTSIVAYIVLFAATGAVFLLFTLLLGRLLRANVPTPQKLETYECGEPTIGTSFVQFDLRFYVVALVFIIFEVEVAFFFPWATVFGKAVQIDQLAVEAAKLPQEQQAAWGQALDQKFRELGATGASAPKAGNDQGWQTTAQGSRALAVAAMIDMSLFFALLMLAFAYVWRRGDLDWVRATSQLQAAAAEPSRTAPSTVAAR